MENNSYQFANAFRSFSVKAGAEHVYPLFDRSASLSFASEEYRNIGIGAIVSGGARGIDTVSETEALLNGSFVVEYLSGSLLKKLRKSDTVRQIQNGSLLLMSAARPDAGFHVGMAMMRNRYIYAQSDATVVVRSDLNKGGTWTGASENLRKNWCPTLCWDHPYPGNQALIEKGAIPVTADWDGTIPEKKTDSVKEEIFEQMSLFDQA